LGREASTVHQSTVEAFFVSAADHREDRNGSASSVSKRVQVRIVRDVPLVALSFS